jgi:hypothetical protein
VTAVTGEPASISYNLQPRGKNGKFIRSGRAFKEGTGKSTARSPTFYRRARRFGKRRLERAAHSVGIGSQTDQSRSESAVGEDPKGIAASSGENNWFDSCEAHHVTVSPQEDRGGTTEKVGEGEDGSEEGGVAVIVASPALFNVQCRTPRQIDLANSLAWNEVILSG